MLLHYYKITLINQDIPTETRTWIKQASDLPSAWRKFITQHFGVLKPNAQDYNITYDHSKSV